MFSNVSVLWQLFLLNACDTQSKRKRFLISSYVAIWLRKLPQPKTFTVPYFKFGSAEEF